MKIFILEDDPSRIGAFAAKLQTHELTVATNIDEAKDKFTGDYDLVLLDHDLGGRVHVNGKDVNTGSEFVRWMPCDKVDKNRTVFIVHSYNQPAAHSMVKTLFEMGFRVSRIPYSPELIEAINKKREKQNDN